ncbi:hypothetical protein [Labilibacter marinus]|uniref:hypothetical protein n=1 Tax=Labilibacter marinus TaxID=1477105 RepID=UPI00130133D9|nr:hypothetical protein [Labilibacter marinus]
MKKFKYLFTAMALVASMSLVSCGNEDDPQPQDPEVIQPLPPELPEQPIPPVVNPH